MLGLGSQYWVPEGKSRFGESCVGLAPEGAAEDCLLSGCLSLTLNLLYLVTLDLLLNL